MKDWYSDTVSKLATRERYAFSLLKFTLSDIPDKNLSTANVMTYGIAAGWALWLTAYPLDIIKASHFA